MTTDATINDLIHTNPAEAARRIERQITLTTWGRIHELRVEVTVERVIVFGRTLSHYVRQLALQAVFDVLGSATAIPVEFRVDVGRGDRHVLPGENDLWGLPTKH